MDMLEDLDASVPVAIACRTLGASRATLYRRTSPTSPPKPRLSSPPRRLSSEECARVAETLHTPEFVDQPPAEVFATLLSRGVYLASIRTMYRILARLGESNERRRGHQQAHEHVKPSLTATAPNQVWTWDITKVAGLDKGVFFYVYVILDLFSRYIVGWLVAERENASLATHLLAETIEHEGIEPGQLTVHSDRGSPMTAGTMTQLLASLEVGQSFSRPRISDDNPFVESHFKTSKYQPDYPGRFASLLHTRGWFETFFGWYNDEHHHTGLALFTPADVFHGRVQHVAAQRQAALDTAYAAHRERFVKGPPCVALPPDSVSINPPENLPSEPAIRSSEPPPEASVRPSPTLACNDRAQTESRAAQPARVACGAGAPLTRASTVVPSSTRWVDASRSIALTS